MSTVEARIRREHPLRQIRVLANEALKTLSADFAVLYCSTGRPSIPPEMLLRSILLQAFYSIRSERQLMERLEFDLLFRWFVGLGVDEPAWDHSTFSKNRVNLIGPAFIDIKGQEGEMRFIAVTAWLDIRYDVRPGSPIAEFSWRASTKATSAPAADGS